MALVARPLAELDPWPSPGSPTLALARATERPEISESARQQTEAPVAPARRFSNLREKQEHHGKVAKPRGAGAAVLEVVDGNAQSAANVKEQQKLEMIKRIGERLSQAMEDSKAVTKGPGFQSLRAGLSQGFGPPVVMGDEYLMTPKDHGTYDEPVQMNLRWGCDRKLADEICNFNRKGAEDQGYLFESTTFLADELADGPETEVTFYDSNTGKPLFYAPRGRTVADFVKESNHHGWPSFRDAEVNWTSVRVLPNGECVSVHGTHLGHNLPDDSGNRYCINLVSVAGRPQRR